MKRRLWPICLLLTCVPWLGGARSALECAAEALGFQNRNASIPAGQYRQNYTRDLVSVNEAVAGLAGSINALPPGAKVFDAGGGLSVYGFQLAEKGFDVTTVNAQDFLAERVAPLTELPAARAYLRAMNDDSLLRLARSLGIWIPSDLRETDFGLLAVERGVNPDLAARAVARLARAILERTRQIEGAGHIKRISAFVQEVLPKIESGSQDVVIDSFGAYYYSSDRLNLMSEYYRILRPGKKAHIALPPDDDLVMVDGEDMTFDEFLTKLYPAAFQRILPSRTRGSTLILTKNPPPPDFQKLAAILGHPEIRWAEKEGVVRPVLTFTVTKMPDVGP